MVWKRQTDAADLPSDLWWEILLVFVATTCAVRILCLIKWRR